MAGSKTVLSRQAASDFTAQANPPGGAPPCFESDFLVMLGDRVRETRIQRGMTRRELARRSGISERYIARIEGGKGNVSIMLLLRISRAIRDGWDGTA